MPRIVSTSILGLAVLVLGVGQVFANLDPMAVLKGRAAGSNALDPMTALTATSEASAGAAGNEEFGGLPDGAGAEETFYQCTACHSTEIIKQQRVTDHRWDEVWTWMVDTQGMVEPDAETKTMILAYLKEHFSPER